MVNTERVSDRSTIVEGRWRNKIIIEGQRQNPEIVAFPEKLEGIT